MEYLLSLFRSEITPFPPLPPEIICLIVEHSRWTLSTLRYLIRTNPVWINIISNCVRKIVKDYSHPAETVSANFILNIPRIERVEIPIRVDRKDQLAALAALKNLTVYGIQLSPSIYSGRLADDYRYFYELVVSFFESWRLSNKRIKPEIVSFSRQRNGLLSRTFGFPRDEISFRYEYNSLWLNKFLFRDRYHFEEILKNLNSLRAIETLVITPGIISDSPYETNSYTLRTVIEKYPITTFEYNKISGNSLYSIFEILILVESMNRILLAPRSIMSDIDNRLQYLQENSRELDQVFTRLISEGKLKTKIVDLFVPFQPLTIPKVIRIFPNVRSLGIWDSELSELERQYPDRIFYPIPL